MYILHELSNYPSTLVKFGVYIEWIIDNSYRSILLDAYYWDDATAYILFDSFITVLQELKRVRIKVKNELLYTYYLVLWIPLVKQ